MTRVMVLSGLGINCEEETEAAYKQVGAKTEKVHINELFRECYRFEDYNLVHIPGGFSYGDHLGAGRALANQFRFKKTVSGKSLYSQLCNFIEKGGFVFGVCNGFQVLVNLGLLPSFKHSKPSLALTENKGGRFIDLWMTCHWTEEGRLSSLWPDRNLDLPLRHGEGRLYVPEEKAQNFLKEKKLVVMRYQGENPNGSFDSAAALSSEDGRVLGMMPHPEAFLSSYNHPEWGLRGRRIREQGFEFFTNLTKYVGA